MADKERKRNAIQQTKWATRQLNMAAHRMLAAEQARRSAAYDSLLTALEMMTGLAELKYGNLDEGASAEIAKAKAAIANARAALASASEQS